LLLDAGQDGVTVELGARRAATALSAITTFIAASTTLARAHTLVTTAATILTTLWPTFAFGDQAITVGVAAGEHVVEPIKPWREEFFFADFAVAVGIEIFNTLTPTFALTSHAAHRASFLTGHGTAAIAAGALVFGGCSVGGRISSGSSGQGGESSKCSQRDQCQCM
jgi:hypothetical protein